MAREGEFDSCAADGLNFNMTPILQYRLLGFFIILLGLGLGIGLIVVVGWILYRKFGTPVPSAVTCAGARQVRSSSTEGSPSSHDQSPIEGPMSDYISNALKALQPGLKTNVVMEQLNDMLEVPAGGFMNATEAKSVRNAECPMGRVLEILLGKGDKEFNTFCHMLERSNHGAWADSLRQKAEWYRSKNQMYDWKASVPFVHPEYDVEEADRYYLEKAIKKFLKDKLDVLKLKKDLYRHTYYGVEHILEANAQHFRHMVRAAELATEDEEDARALTTTRTVAELLDKLCIKTKWEDTELLAEIVLCLPKEPRTLALSLLKRYDGYLEVYDELVSAKDSLQKQLIVPEGTKPQVPVEVTVSKCLAEFMNKDCKDIVNLLIHNSYKIPRSKIMATAIEPGSTTVVFLIDKAFMEKIIYSSCKMSSLWAFQELHVTRVRVGDFELNVIQLLTQHFKEALRSGLTGSMDFVGATKALPYQVYALVDPDISEKVVIRTVYRKITQPCPEQEELVSGTADSEGVETTPKMYEDTFSPKVEEEAKHANEGKIKEATDSGELLSRVQELEDELKNSEWKRVGQTQENMALVNYLKVCQEQKDHTEQENASLKKRLVSMLSSQGGADNDSALTTPSDGASKRIPHRWWLKVLAGSYDTSLLPSFSMKQTGGSREMEGEVVFRRDTKSNLQLLKAVSGTEWMYQRGALERGRRANLRRHQFTRYHRRWLADNVQKEEEDSCKLWLLQSSPDMGTVRKRVEHQVDEGKMIEEVTGSGELLSRVQELKDELKDSERKRMDLIQSNTALQKIVKACREQAVHAGGADQDSAPTAPSKAPLKRTPRRWWLKIFAGSHDTSLLPLSCMEQAKGDKEMEGEVVFRRDTKSNLLKAVSGTEWMYRRGTLERGRRHQFACYHRSWLADNVEKEEEESCKQWLLRSSPDVGSVREGEEQALMSKVYEQALRDYHEKLAGDLIVQNVISDLEPYLTKEEYLQVNNKLGNMAQVDELFRILLTKGNRHFKGFCHVLEDNGYQHWAQQLRSSIDGTEAEVVTQVVSKAAPIEQRHLGFMQSDDQDSSIGKSSHTPTGYSSVSAGDTIQSMPHTGAGNGEVIESVPLQEWPSVSEESKQLLPTTAPPVSQASSMLDKNSAMVQVEGVSGLNSKYLSIAFDNEDQGGGEIDDIVLNGDVALITFKDVIVAAQVASKAVWQVMGRTLPVSLYQPKPDPLQDILARHTRENTLVLKELPASVNDARLALHIELVTGLSDETDYKLDRKGDTALIQLNENIAQDVWQKLSYSNRPLDKVTKAMIKVEFLAPASAVLMKHLEDDCCNEEFLKMYFGNKENSGAGVNVTVEITGRGEALISFENLNVIPGVLSHTHTKELGQDVSVKLYHPILSHWFSADGTGDKQPQRAVSVQHKRFTVPVSASVGKHLKRVDLITPLNAQMADTCGKATLREKGILVEPTNDREWTKQWSTQCRDIVNKFISNISELSLEVPPAVMSKVYSVIVAQVHNPNVTISPSDTEDRVILVGSTLDVEELGTKVKKIICENLDTVQQETLPVPVSEKVPPQEWPSFSSESEQPLPTTAQPVIQASSLSDQKSAIVQVKGVGGLNSKYLRVAFDNEEQGGGEIDDIVLNGDIALITFRDVKVATQVVSKVVWNVMGRTVPVSLYQPKPDPLQDILARHTSENTLVLKELPASVNDEYLALHIELVTGLSDETDYKLDRKGDTALIQLNRNIAQDVWQRLSYSNRPLDKVTKAMIKVEFLAPASAVLMKHLEDDCCNEEFLKMYFGNKENSGAGVNVTVEITGRGEALISFENLSVIPGVLSHTHTKELGQDVSVKLYHPILSHWFSADGTGDKRPQRAESVQHKRFTVPVSASVGKHLKRVDLIAPLNAQMADTCGKATLCEKGILVEPTTGSEWIKQWSSQCRDIVKRFISNISELSLDVPPGVMSKVYSVIVAQVHNPNVTISPSDTEDQVVLVGSTLDVEELGTKVKKIIYENLDTQKEETLPVPVLVLIDHCVQQRLKGTHKNVLFSVDLQKQVLKVSGKDVGCDQFLEEVRALHPQVIDVRLEEEAVGLLASGNGKPLLLSKIGAQPVGYYFTTAEGKLPDTDMATVSKLHLVSENRKMAIKVAQSLQSTITMVRVDVPEEFHKHTVCSEAWRAARRRIENEFIARLCPKPDSKRISIVCDSIHAERLKLDLEQFVRGECYKDSAIELERLQWEYLDTYSKDWRDLLAKMKDSGLTHSIPGETGPAVIKMKGEATPVSTFTRRIHEIRDGIKVQKKEMSNPGAVKHFRSTGGRSALKGIAAEQKAVVEVYTVEEEIEERNRVTGSLHRKICHGTTDDGRLVYIMQGDLTEFSVDVMVNAANEELNHSRGIAGIISRKGGSIVQEESTKYVRRAGRLRVGDAVLLKPAGSLPCKAIVHAVGPRWNTGKDLEEAYLAKAVRNSLVEASKHNYTSIVFPTISSGIFGVPIDVCAKAMMQGIKDFSAQGHPPHLHSITIMLFQKEHITPFTKASSVALKSFSEQMGRQLAQQPHTSTQKRSSSTGSRRPSCSGVPVAQALELKKGSLTSYPADVYVNTAHHMLDLRHGAVAQSLLMAGGSVLQDECDRVVATQGTIPYWDIVTTTGGNLQCQHTIHTVGQQYTGGSSVKNLERMILKVMQECDHLKATSVAFPALGTGNLTFPEDVVAEVMVRTISGYLQQNPGTTVKKVLLVIFMDSTHKAFQQAMSSQLPSAPPPVEDDFELLSEEVGTVSSRPSEVFSGPSEVLYSFSCNRINVDIVNGDISADDSEGIVNAASETLQLHNFGVMGALRRRGGQQLQDECTKAVAMHGKLEQYKVIVTGVGNRDADGLKCQKILHVLAPQHSGGLARTVSEALKRADKEGLQSVALPAIGTGEHGFSSAEAAEGIADGIVHFSKSVHDRVASIKVILFQREQFGNFAQAFEEAGKKKGFLRRLFDKVASGTGHAVQSFLDIPPTLHSTPQPPATVHYSENTVLCIKVYAGDTSAIDSVFKAVDKVIAETIKEEYVRDEKINKLSAKVEVELVRQAEKHHVRVSIDRAPLNQVRFNGEREDVLTMKDALWQELRSIENEEKREKEAELLTSKFQWQWKDDNGDFQDYEPMTNLEIEEAYSGGRQSVKIRTEEGPRTINFSQWSEEQVQPPYNHTAVRRRGYDKERKEGEQPSSWEPMPKDPGTGKQVECYVVQLSSHSQEYRDVAAQFNSTMATGGTVRSLHSSLRLVHGQASQGRIVKIERIQNSKLYAQYTARKKAMDRGNVGHQNEKQLFHGCSLSAVDSINNGGFNRSYAGQHGTAFGRGVYFARDASYSSSSRYAAPDHNGHQHMYLARVLTGEYTTGQGDFLVPPAKDPRNPAVLYDSVVNDIQNPAIFVIFYDPQAYPEYHIEFS